MFERYVEERHVRMLKFQAFLAGRERAVADREQLLFIQVQLALVVDRPFKFSRHAQRIDGTGVHAHPAEQAASHVHVIFF